MESKIVFNADENAGSIYVMKVFKVQPTELWKYFTQAENLQRWWAPNPWTCETLEMDFKADGKWQYNLISPAGEKFQAGLQFNETNDHRSFDFTEYFNDASGNKLQDHPAGNWLIGFTGVSEGTKLTINIQFKSPEDLQKVLAMDFKTEFPKVLSQLENLVHKKD